MNIVAYHSLSAWASMAPTRRLSPHPSERMSCLLIASSGGWSTSYNAIRRDHRAIRKQVESNAMFSLVSHGGESYRGNRSDGCDEGGAGQKVRRSGRNRAGGVRRKPVRCCRLAEFTKPPSRLIILFATQPRNLKFASPARRASGDRHLCLSPDLTTACGLLRAIKALHPFY